MCVNDGCYTCNGSEPSQKWTTYWNSSLSDSSKRSQKSTEKHSEELQLPNKAMGDSRRKILTRWRMLVPVYTFGKHPTFIFDQSKLSTQYLNSETSLQKLHYIHEKDDCHDCGAKIEVVKEVCLREHLHLMFVLYTPLRGARGVSQSVCAWWI